MEYPGKIIDLGPAWQYRLESEIARSTFGVVWQAQWLQTGRRVALKTVHRARMLRAAPEQQAMWPQALQHEIGYLQFMDHPHLVSMRHHGQHDTLPVLVLEQLHTSLARDFTQHARPFPLPQALELVRQVASGLAYLHGLGMRHLDIKPENLLLTAPGPLQRLKIADLGSALGLRGEVAANHEHGFTGSLGWLAPEQVLPSRVSEGEGGQAWYRTSSRTDVYALGLLLFYLLTGEKTEFSQQAALALQKHSVLEQHDFLAQLAQAGLSEQDSINLATGLNWGANCGVNGHAPIDQQADSLAAPEDPTWLPGNETIKPLPASEQEVGTATEPALPTNKSQVQIRIEGLLHRLLSDKPEHRLCDAMAVRQAVTCALDEWAA